MGNSTIERMYGSSLIFNSSDIDEAVSDFETYCNTLDPHGLYNHVIPTQIGHRVQVRILLLKGIGIYGDTAKKIATKLATQIKSSDVPGPAYGIVGTINWGNGTAFGALSMQYTDVSLALPTNSGDQGTCPWLEASKTNFIPLDPELPPVKPETHGKRGVPALQHLRARENDDKIYAANKEYGITVYMLGTQPRLHKTLIHQAAILGYMQLRDAIDFDGLTGYAFGFDGTPLPFLGNAVIKFLGSEGGRLDYGFILEMLGLVKTAVENYLKESSTVALGSILPSLQGEVRQRISEALGDRIGAIYATWSIDLCG